MAGGPSPPITPRPRPRIPSGPRPPSFTRVSSGPSIPTLGHRASTEHFLEGHPSLTSLRKLDAIPASPLDQLANAPHDFSASPENSPLLDATTDLPSVSPPQSFPNVSFIPDGPGTANVHTATDRRVIEISPERGHTAGPGSSQVRVTSPTRSQTAAGPSSGILNSFKISRPGTPVKSPPIKPKPKPSRLNSQSPLAKYELSS